MFRKLIEGLLYGTGFAIAFVAVVTLYFQVVVPNPMMANKQASRVELSGGKPAEVVTSTAANKREFQLHKDGMGSMTIPPQGGILSLAIIEGPADGNRPSTFQAWVTESEAFVVRTKGDKPEVEKVPYPDGDAADYASGLVYNNVGFQEANASLTVSADEIQKLKTGLPSSRDFGYNGTFKITTDGVVFFLPNEYE